MDPLNIDAILGEGGDAPDPEEGVKPEGGEPQKPEPDKQPKEGEKKDNEVVKNLQEQLRQQSEEMKSLKENNEKMMNFLDKITGKDEDTQKKVREAIERKEWEQDTPTKVKEIVNDLKENFNKKVDKVRMEAKLGKIYSEIEAEYDVDFDKVAPKVLPILDRFTPEAKKENPKEVILNAIKIAGELKEKEGPNVVVSGATVGNKGVTKKQVEAEAEAIKKRIFGSSKRKEETVFGI